MTGLKLAQTALFFGADDMDGTVVEEVISLMSEAGHGQDLPKSELVRVIRATGRTPVERDALYRVVRRYAPEGEAEAGAAPGGGEVDEMTVRVGHIEFLNCYPLYHGLQQRGVLTAERLVDRPGRPGLELLPGVPTDLNRMAARRAISTLGLSARSPMRGTTGVAGVAPREHLVAGGCGQHPVGHAAGRWPRSGRVALTRQSATSVALLKTIFKLRLLRRSTYRDLAGPVTAALDEGDAVLLIGDQALDALHFPSRARSATTWARCGRNGPGSLWCTRSGRLARSSPGRNGPSVGR